MIAREDRFSHSSGRLQPDAADRMQEVLGGSPDRLAVSKAATTTTPCADE
jgi:hypothetical protein